MHPYYFEDRTKIAVAIILAFLSVITAWLLYEKLFLWLQVEIPWWIESPSIFGLYALYFQIFDEHLWKKLNLKLFGLKSIPDLNGEWPAEVTSSFNNFSPIQSGVLIIRQTYSRMLIRYKNEQSYSRSLTASLFWDEGEGQYHLNYQYTNNPNFDQVSTMNMHHGTATLRISGAKVNLIEGEYYTGRGRETHGTIKAKKG